MPATLAQRMEGLMEGEGAAESVDGHVGASIRRILDGLPNLLRTQIARVDRGDGTFLSRLRKLANIDIDSHHHRVIRGRDLHRGKPNAASAVDGKPLTGLDGSAPNNGTVSGHIPAAERRCRQAVNALR